MLVLAFGSRSRNESAVKHSKFPKRRLSVVIQVLTLLFDVDSWFDDKLLNEVLKEEGLVGYWPPREVR